MTTRKGTDWVVLTDKGSSAMCTRCGGTQSWSMPIDMTVLAAIAKAFTKAHKSCKPDPRGEVCTHCDERGHDSDPARCLKLVSIKTADQWIRSTDTGISSLTIYAALMSNPAVLVGWGPDVPHDPSDFGRCHRLLKRVPGWRERLHEVAAKYPAWAPLVEHWDELEKLYAEELPSGRCLKLWARMQELRAG